MPIGELEDEEEEDDIPEKHPKTRDDVDDDEEVPEHLF